ncbi:SCO family protein [Paraburkholderia sp. RL18-103-BIB-C]
MDKLTQVLQQHGDHAGHVRVLFFTVGSSRDTPAVLHNYIDAFDAGTTWP